jgi:hypothetical protein
LKCHDGGRLEAEVSLVVLGDFTHQPLERQLADEQLSTLLVLADLCIYSSQFICLACKTIVTTGCWKTFVRTVMAPTAGTESGAQRQHEPQVFKQSTQRNLY